MKNAKRDYRQHKRNSALRGIGFDLTFEQWWAIWQQSGQYPNRGRRLGQYVMARKWDSGPYAVDNVEIQQCSENGRTREKRRRFRKINLGAEKVADSLFVLGETSDPLELLCEAEGDSF